MAAFFSAIDLVSELSQLWIHLEPCSCLLLVANQVSSQNNEGEVSEVSKNVNRQSLRCRSSV